LNIHKVKIGRIADNDSIYNAGYLIPYILELLINMVILPPYVESVYKLKGSIYIQYDMSKYFNFNMINSQSNNDYLFPEEVKEGGELIELVYSLSNVLTIFILIRSYHFIRLIHTYSYWATPRAENICKLMNTEATIGFGIKAYLKINPFLTLGIGIFFVILFFGLGVKIFEYYGVQVMELLNSTEDAYNGDFAGVMKKFENMLNCFWLILVTMTTSK
jgi:hypothetical protein